MAVSLFFTITDAKGDPSTVDFPFPDATPVAVLAAAVPAVAALLQPLITGGLKTAGFKVEVDVPLFGPVATLASDVQEKAEFAVRTVNGFLKRLNLPTFDEAFFVPNTKEVDRTDPDIQAFVDFLEDGITVSATLIQPTDDRGEDLVTVERARENWGRRRR
jgi:hypothetical protein